MLQSTYSAAQLRWPKPLSVTSGLYRKIQLPVGLFQLFNYITYTAKKKKKKKVQTKFIPRGDLSFQMLLYSQCVDQEWQQYSSGMGTALASWDRFCPEITCKTLSTQFLPSMSVMATCGACCTCAPSKQRALKFLGCNSVSTDVENPFFLCYQELL